MTLTRSTLLPRLLASASLAGLCLAAPLAAMAADAGTSPDIEARYKLDVERCNTGQTNQDKATCLREAGAARDESRRNRLINANQSYQQNQVSRCQALSEPDRQDCMMQMSGQNTKVEGSIGAGGVLRETTITIPGTPVPATTPAAPPVTPAPGLTPNPPATVPAPSLTPAAPAAPGTTVTPMPAPAR